MIGGRQSRRIRRLSKCATEDHEALIKRSPPGRNVENKSAGDQSPDQDLDRIGATRRSDASHYKVDTPEDLSADEKHAGCSSPFPSCDEKEQTAQAVENADKSRGE
jgi:hypothetical protein